MAISPWSTALRTLGVFGGHDLFNSPFQQDGLAGRYGLSWLKVSVAGDTRYLPVLLAAGPDRGPGTVS